MTRKKVFIGLGIVILVGAMIWANFAFKKTEGPTVTVEAIKQRDLESVVSASGKIRARRTVNITSEVSGKVMKLAVEEGDRVKTGQFLLQVDPRNVRSRLQVSQASLEQQRISLQQARTQLENARVNLKQATEELQRQQRLDKDSLATKQALEQAENAVAIRRGEVKNAEQAVSTADQRIRSQQADLESAQHDLSRVTIESPIDGLVIKRNVEEGETAVVGFTNNPSVVLLTVADMSVIEAEIEVDETDIPTVQLGQKTKVTIDALPDRSFAAKVTEIGNSPINATSASVGGVRQATNFKVVVTIEGQIPDVRPGFTCTADITTATRSGAISVPIQALTVRELTYDAKGNVVRQPAPEKGRRPSTATTVEAAELKPGQTKKETEGVFVVDKDNKVTFVPVKTGIAGDKYFEVLSGLKAKDRVITGPFTSVRNLADGGQVKIEDAKK
ncbi:MAG TPA: efflux RND transporter periplasmic adaptor subunit [Vicinamibacterales bacterium]|jgi:HlyD family secretion protein